MNISTREAVSSDAQMILSLVHEAFKQYEGKLDPPSGAHKETVETIENKINEGGAFIVECDGNAAGCALWKRNNDNLYMGRLAVVPVYRKLGIGNKLLEMIEKKAKELAFNRILIGVRIGIPSLIEYYKKRGFEITEYCCHEGYNKPTFVRMMKKI
jgi:N-acetylglutamate synthase-like GNAT family acetyltransferase